MNLADRIKAELDRLHDTDAFSMVAYDLLGEALVVIKEELRQAEIDRRYARIVTDDLIDTLKSLDKVDNGTVIRALMGWNE